jgi:hypothetical protein
MAPDMPNSRVPYDLLIIPQMGQVIPTNNVPPEQTEQAINDWHNYGTQPTPSIEHRTWVTAVAHIKKGELAITSIAPIPRSI